MLRQIVDLHIHSKYSRACSKRLELPVIAKACETRGIDIVVTGDMTHPQWVRHMKASLHEVNEGIFSLKDGSSPTKFVIGTELSSIKKHKGKTRRIHLCVFAPNFEVLDRFNKTLFDRGFNLASDGRPILGIPCKEILQIMLDTDPRMVMIPAHVWTPWFGLFGSKGGYDSLEECFEELSPHIKAIETGLSSDPLMNWRVSSLDHLTLVSNSDAHSPQKLGREANVLAFKDEIDVTYTELFRIIQEGDKEKFLYTIEFYPEEGKYHSDGHRDCKVVMSPEETQKHQGICPVCNKKVTVGVLNRVFELSDRTKEEAKEAGKKRIPCKHIVPLPEILADTFSCGVATKKVQTMYDHLISSLGNEFFILESATFEDIESVSTKHIADAIFRVRSGNIVVRPGYDGEFGVVKVFEEGKHSEGIL
ncbi:MAG: DNA helicase UvrD [Candidatus Magasanikbacteria bacterium]|jgi:DNA helicase II / ATP-dependent DNA helicase PcrA|nr:DNA helicase UvrD [Candidatus Magasanikbacteria bacterium]MBT4221199.1 DNA helicase UvrD [Candidatus Magasanikbacteria bacterium]MBT4350041.1 DNA helicase UvrD [Candidatus Magasanikbacteria bacterium]MBT4541981.1 DNA helicase UvrD [Candidatus Magasanikbacteria bacterium]MBT6252736.1 DNA helicase UvrD [Candidatus Magasanikbacteria bacterium]